MEKLFEILEFDKIKEMLLKVNINDLSLKKVNELRPHYFLEVVQEELNKTKEAYLLVNLGTFPSFHQVPDLFSYLERVHKNAVLNLQEIYDFVISLEAVVACKQFVSSHKSEMDKFYFTFKYIEALQPINDLMELIKYCVSINYTLNDHASSKLKTIRSSIKKNEQEIKEKLNSFLRNNASMLSDNYIATRGSHYVLPVKAAYKNQIKGIVIDVSSTQNTYFIEPYSVMECNALLEQLHYEEEVEIQRIIKALCEEINRRYEVLLKNNEYLAEISFMLLKGQYGLTNQYEVATLNEKNQIDLIEAFHPLIDLKKVIKNDFHLGGSHNRILVISGPNAGGKTVALKTIALLVLMNQCGLPLPVKEANLPIFRNIFIDIGDEQSIEQSLSGFSSHMKNVSEIINQIDSHSLVIMDELGSKTDPNEGEALAKAIIDYIEDSQAIAMITTHYLGIKDYAKENSQITLSSMGFDEETLLPTYKLILNVVGRSYALEISSRLGLKEQIIEKARQYKKEQAIHLDHIIDELSLKLKKENEIIDGLKEKEQLLNQKLIEVESEKDKIQKELEKSLQSVQEKKNEMIEEAYVEIQQIVDEFKNSSAKEGFKHHLKNQAIEKLDHLMDQGSQEIKKNEKIQVGDYVKILSLDTYATVKEIKGNKCVISNKNTTLIVSLNEIEKAIKPTSLEKKKKVKVGSLDTLAKNVPMSVNLIGMHVDEALIALRNYLDAALLVRYQQVSVIHGFGTGALRKAVHEYLKKNKYVEEFALGGYNEGGAGATIVKLKVKK